jgi:acyl dehydratase
MNLLGEPLRVGHPVHTAERVVASETMRFYRETFGDHHPFYGESPFGGPIAPPLLFHSEVYAHPERWYLKNLVGNLHAQQEWWLFSPLRPGMRVSTRSTVVERYRKRNRDYVVNETDYLDPEGRLLLRGRTHQSFLAEPLPAQGEFVVDPGSARKKERRAVGEGPGEEIEPVELVVDETVCWRFSGPNRTYHTDREQARKLGFPDIVVQGLLSTCLISQVMANAFGEGWFAGGRMDVKLVNVLWAGESVRARGKFREELPEGAHRRRVLEVWVEKTVAPGESIPITVGRASALV